MTFGEFIEKNNCTDEEVKSLLAYWIALRMIPFAEILFMTTRKTLFPKIKNTKQ